MTVYDMIGMVVTIIWLTLLIKDMTKVATYMYLTTVNSFVLVAVLVLDK